MTNDTATSEKWTRLDALALEDSIRRDQTRRIVEYLEREAAAPVHGTAKTRAVLEAVAKSVAREFGASS